MRECHDLVVQAVGSLIEADAFPVRAETMALVPLMDAIADVFVVRRATAQKLGGVQGESPSTPGGAGKAG